MKHPTTRFLFMLLILAALMLQLPAMAEDAVHVLDATADLPAMAQGEKADGDSAVFNDFFTILFSAKNKIDGSTKTFDDGYYATQRLNFGGKTQPSKGMINSVMFSVDGPATVKFWWVSGGDGRQFALYNADTDVIASVGSDSVKNSLYISEFAVEAAGTYYLGVPDGSNYLFKLEVAEAAAPTAAEPVTRILDATADLPAMAQGEKADGDSAVFNDFFTILFSAKNKIDGSTKTFDDGYYATQRLNFGGKTQPSKGMINSVMFSVDGPATVKFWWVSGGDGRQFALYNADTDMIASVGSDSVKNSLYISEFAVEAAGTYYLGVPDGSNYLFKLEVTTIPAGSAAPQRAAWSQVEAPVIAAAEDTGAGEIAVSISALVGFDGADEVVVALLDASGSEIASRRSIAEKGEHAMTFAPLASGVYTLRATLTREGEEAKISTDTQVDFVLPLGIPSITSATSKGSGAIELVWTSVDEADGYEILLDGKVVGMSEAAPFTIAGLEVGSKYAFAVRALRGEEKGAACAETAAIATADAQRTWSFTVYGPSTNQADNGCIGSLNEDGQVTVYSENGKGKIQPNADDGVAFYYTAIPADQNFTLRANVHVDNWDYSNGQEGFGLMAADSIGPMGAESFLTNQYMALASKIEYYWNAGQVSTSGTKYTMRLGLGVLAKLGRTADTKDAILGVTWPLETSAAWRVNVEEASNFNIIGNNTNRDILDKTALTIQELTDFILEIQKNNTGYFITYYAEDGSIIGQYKDYDPNALSLLDPDNVYVGFFCARRARATFSDVVLEVIDPAQDAAAEERAVVKVLPTLAITSAGNSNSLAYTLSCVTNAAGTVDVWMDGDRIAQSLPAVAEIRNDYPITLPGEGERLIEVVFKPDPDQDLGEGFALASTKSLTAECTVVYVNAFAHLKEIHVSPTGTPTGSGTQDKPLSLAAAVQYVQPGQTIVLAEGTYHFIEPLRIPHGIDGTAEQPIRMVADSAAASRPVLDFGGLSAGIIHGGDHWYFSGFDVTGAANNHKGFQVSGHFNILERIDAYRNGNTGIQISRYAGSDPTWDWPSNNLILNCTAWSNVDAGYEDADGFAAKLTCGPGNVFDGCVAYNNADDGFDLYAKVETGPIGAVVIRNSVAYLNGILEDGTIGGNGNGFKLGGSNIPGGHQLINSYAFFNRSKGIDSNSCPDVIIQDCVSYNNQRYNVALYTNIQQDTAFVANGVISFKDGTIAGGDATEADEFKPKGAQDPAAYLNDTCYYWDGAQCANASGQQITADWFVSLEFKGVKRHADGSIDLQGFLQKAAE